MPYLVANQGVGFGVGTDPNTPAALTTWPKFTDISLKGKRERVRDETHHYGQVGLSEDQIASYANGIEGGFAGPVTAKGFFLDLLEVAMGPPPTVTVDNPAVGWTRRVYIKGSPAKVLTGQRLIANSSSGVDAYTYTGIVVQTLEISADVNKFLSYAATILGNQERDDVAAGTPAAPVGTSMLVVPASIAITITSDAGATTYYDCATGYKLTITNKHEEIATLCGRSIQADQPVESVTLELTDLDYTKAWWTAMNADKSLVVAITHTLASDTNTTVKIDLPAAKVISPLPDQSATALRVKQSIQMEAATPTAGGSLVTITTTSVT